LVRPDQAKDAPEAVERLNHARDEGGVRAVPRKNGADGCFELADQFFRFLLFLIGHFRSPSTRSTPASRRSSSASVRAPWIGLGASGAVAPVSCIHPRHPHEWHR